MNKSYRAIGYYAIANIVIAATGMLLTVLLARELGAKRFGDFASFLALQNIWATISFCKFDSRIAQCNSNFSTVLVYWSGFSIGIILSLLFTALTLFSGIDALYVKYVFLSGFALSVFDALSLRAAYQNKVLTGSGYRFCRVVCPLLAVYLTIVNGESLKIAIIISTLLLLIFILITAFRSPSLKVLRFMICKSFSAFKNGLYPAILMSLTNSIWLNGMTPFLNLVLSPSTSGVFAFLQRVLGGGFGLLGHAIFMSLTSKEHTTFFKWSYYKTIIKACFVLSSIGCITLYILLYFFGNELLGSDWSFELPLYFSISVFLVFSFSIGSISILAIRLHDEWVLLLWQVIAIIFWLISYMLFKDGFLSFSLILGGFLYIYLLFRWRYLLVRKEVTDGIV